VWLVSTSLPSHLSSHPPHPSNSTSAAPALPQSVRCAAPGPGPGLLCPSLLLPCSTSRVATLRLPRQSASTNQSVRLCFCRAPRPVLPRSVSTPIRIHKPDQTRPDQTRPNQTRPHAAPSLANSAARLGPACIGPRFRQHIRLAPAVPLPHPPTLQSRLCLSGPSAAPRVRRVRVEL